MSHRNQSESTETLSDDGLKCRDAMRQRLCREVVNAHRTRRQRRRHMTAASLIIASVFVGLLVMLPSMAGNSPSKFVEAPAIELEHQPLRMESPQRVLIVQTTESVSDKYRIDRNLKAKRATDEQLLDAIHEIGQSAGLVRTDHRTILVLNHSG